MFHGVLTFSGRAYARDRIQTMRKVIWLFVLGLAAATALPAARTLDFYFIDTEGGQATLIVTPSGESLLVDAGWPGFEGRDANRIVAAAKAAGIRRIDFLLVTHYHSDHVGGVPQLAERMAIGVFVDKGPLQELTKGPQELFEAYERAIAKQKRLVVKPGDRLPIRGVDVRFVCAAGNLITVPLEGAGQPNSLCGSEEKKKTDTSENAMSAGFVLSYNGKFRFLDLGDLTWNKEMELVCPRNNVGKVDVYLTTHHGLDWSNCATIVHAVAPRVAIMNNGAKKGGSPSAWQIIRKSPGLEDLWQLHFSLAGGKENNSPDPFIANLDEKCEGKWIKMSVQPNGDFTITNSRNNFSKTYKAR
jgi:beta-lactamase superfamily II metal-dependent hydrolase